MADHGPPPPTRWAGAYLSDRFVFIESFVGYRGSVADLRGRGHAVYLAPDASDERLGLELMEALRRSRFVRPMDEPGLYDCRRIERDYEAWLADLLDRFDYATKRAALERLAYCYVRARDGRISIEPTHHDRLEGWNGMPAEFGVTLPELASAAQIGAGLRRAFDHCV